MQTNYRADIQGLRAVAVLLVFFSHADWPLFSGGFVGVDIFFVISGYVITQVLLKEFREQHAIKLHRFYARRLQRLLPALVFMVLVTTLVSLVILTPEEQLFQYNSAISALIWVSNIFFLFADINYFAPAASDNLYLHTWSLGVEEQFYLLWPFIILAGLGYFSGSRGSSRLKSILLLTLIISLTLSLFFSVTSAGYAFYLMPARAWQFALGALVACAHNAHLSQFRFRLPVPAGESIAIAGVGLVALSVIWFDKSTPYPNWQVCIPTLGVTLILLAYQRDKLTLTGKLLSLAPLRWLGDISYSFYLWHCPVLLFFERLKPYYPGVDTMTALATTTVMAALSCYLIENPIRRNRRLLSLPKPVVSGALTVMVLVCATMYGLKTYSGLLSNDPEQLQFVEVRKQKPVIYQYGCDDWFVSAEVRPCVFDTGASDKKAVLIGDSVLAQWFPAIAEYFLERNWQLVVLTKSSCPMVNRSFFYDRIKSTYHVCDQWREQAIKEIAALNPQLVIMGSSSGYPFSRAEWQQGTREIFDQLLPYAEQIKLIAATPGLGIDGPACLARLAWVSSLLPGVPQSSCSRKRRSDQSWIWLSEVASEYPGVQTIELGEAICPGGMCSAKIGDTIVFRDRLHLTTDYVLTLKEMLGEKLSRQIELSTL